MVIEIWQSWDAEQPFTKVSFKPVTSYGSPPIGISEDRTETLEKVVPTNFLIGPSAADLVFFGAKYGPCMRADTRLMASLAQQREEESETLGCCKALVLQGYSAGQTTYEDCVGSDGSAGEWTQGGKCVEGDLTEVIKLRPCCIANNGTCQVTTEEYCTFYDGTWDITTQSCGETNCFANRCGFGMQSSQDPNQWYRLVVPIFLHGGILHFAGNMMVQMSLGTQVESAAGWLRMMLIYLISGMGGNLLSAVFSPDVPSVGCSGALCGLLGVTFVDLFQSWRVVEEPWSKLFKTLGTTILFLLVGTLPFIDNWAHIGGFIFGILSSIIFLPFLTFGSWDNFRKKCIVCLCIPILMTLTFVLFMVFYQIQGTEFCPTCKYIQCIPYTPDFCANTPGWTDN
jgi:membrane associated rhomboid family serine protease